MAGTEVRYGSIDFDYAKQLATTPAEDDGPVWMVNLMRYRPVADYSVDAPVEGAPVSGREADDRYLPTESLAGVGAQIVFGADVETQLLGDAPQWDRVGVVKYPTRRSFIEMQSRPDFQRQHVHKDAGMDQTIVMGCRPMTLPDFPGDLPDWNDVPHPSTEDDGPVMVLHVLRFVDEGIDEMTQYQDHAAPVAAAHGARLAGWFGVEGTIIGDGRSWDQVRFNAFPSRAAFFAMVADPARLRAQHDHREKAIADTYALILRPRIDMLTSSLVGEVPAPS